MDEEQYDPHSNQDLPYKEQPGMGRITAAQQEYQAHHC